MYAMYLANTGHRAVVPVSTVLSELRHSDLGYITVFQEIVKFDRLVARPVVALDRVKLD